MEYINQLNWNIIKRANYRAAKLRILPNGYDFAKIPDKQVVCSSPVLLIGVRSQMALKHWVTGCWVTQYLPFIPSSNTEFTAIVRDPINYRCQLGILNKIEFPYTGVSPFILNLSFPRWIEDASIEVWQYGEALDGTYVPPHTELYKMAQTVTRIEEKLNQNPSDRTLDLQIVEEP